MKLRGIIKLPLELGNGGLRYATRESEFLVVDVESPYNAILGGNSINVFELVISIAHLKAKFLTPDGVGECKGDQKLARELYLKALKGKQVCVVNAEPKDRSYERGKPAEETEEIQLDNDPSHTTQIGTSLSRELRDQLVKFLRDNRDVFAWSPSDMPGISPDVIAHELNLNPKKKPVHQKMRHHAPEK